MRIGEGSEEKYLYQLWFPLVGGGNPTDPYVQIPPCFVTLSYIWCLCSCFCFRGSMSVILVTRHNLQRHSSGIHLVIVGFIVVLVIVHVSVGRLVVVSVKVVGRCELVGHSPRNPLGLSSPLARPFVTASYSSSSVLITFSNCPEAAGCA